LAGRPLAKIHPTIAVKTIPSLKRDSQRSPCSSRSSPSGSPSGSWVVRTNSPTSVSPSPEPWSVSRVSVGPPHSQPVPVHAGRSDRSNAFVENPNSRPHALLCVIPDAVPDRWLQGKRIPNNICVQGGPS
jgi:hypothetical protein